MKSRLNIYLAGYGCIRNVTGKTSPAAAAALALMREKKQKKIKAPGAPAKLAGYGCIRNVTGKTSPAAAAALALMQEKKQKKKIKAPGAPAKLAGYLSSLICHQLNASTSQQTNASTNQRLNPIRSSSFPRRTAAGGARGGRAHGSACRWWPRDAYAPRRRRSVGPRALAPSASGNAPRD